jgi:hypothetical protein
MGLAYNIKDAVLLFPEDNFKISHRYAFQGVNYDGIEEEVVSMDEHEPTVIVLLSYSDSFGMVVYFMLKHGLTGYTLVGPDGMASDNIYAETKIMCERMLERDFLLGKGIEVSGDPAAGEWDVVWSAELRVELAAFKASNAHLLQVEKVNHTQAGARAHTNVYRHDFIQI